MSSPSPAIWYFDVISPFPYISLPRLPEIEARRKVVIRPVLFAGLLKAWGQLGPAEIAAKRVHTYRIAAFTAKRLGLPFRMPPAHPFIPLAILRLLTALDGERGAVERALKLVWGEGRDPNAAETLVAIAGGGDVAAIEALIERTSAKDRLRQTTEEAVTKGVFGVPTLLIDGETFWGADSIDMALAFLDDPSFLSTGEMQRAAVIPKAVERRR